MKIPLDWLKDYIKTDKSPKEIADSFTAIGLMLDKPTDGKVLDLEHRMDRSDWLSIIGCARDLAAYEHTKLIYPKLHAEKGATPKSDQIVKIKVECPEAIHRFNTRTFRGIKVAPSPKWLSDRLESYGLPSINNIVDITNYVMVEIGQPMHAQDLAKFQKPEIVIRMAKDGEEITTLLGTNVKLDTQTAVLTQDNKPIAIMGIVGGKETGVTDTTKDIILDAGTYNQVGIRKTSRRLKIMNETVSRCDKFLHPRSTELAIQRATQLILELAGGTYYENQDWYPKHMEPKQMTLRLSRVKKLSGMDFDIPQVEKILNMLEYHTINKSETEIAMEIPYFRTDVEVEDDLVADVLRINGYANIPVAPMNMAPPKDMTQPIYNFETRLRDVCVRLGLHEHITDPIVKADSTKGQVVLQNSLNSGKDALRTSIYETLLPVITTYTKHRVEKVGIFEIGKVYSVNGAKDNFDSYTETRILQIIYKDANKSPKENAVEVKRILAGLLAELGITTSQNKRVGESTKILVGGTEIGKISYDALELYTEKLLTLAKQSARVTYMLPNERTEDLSLIVETETALGEVCADIQKTDSNVITTEVLEEFTNESIGKDKKAVLIRVKYADILAKDKILESLKKNFKIQTR